ncbi:response regulator [Bacteriovoracales bacterium]|nr:response regulator [Bacteriovoracales bacterium]|tara:strand:- start:34 stop:429 length:396 start_codon:yes stop_codon:yes gene_type:complete
MGKILIIDDSQSTRMKLRTFLETCNHICVEAGNGLEALDRLKESKDYDLIICDVNMPEMNGIEFIDKQSQDEALKTIPTVMCTTESYMGSSGSPSKFAQKAKETGVVRAWVVKPFQPDKVKTIVDRIVSKK